MEQLELLATTLAILARRAAPLFQEWGSAATETALKAFAGDKAKQVAQTLGWLKPKVEEKPVAEGMVKALASQELDPEDAAEAEATLRKQILKLLKEDQDLRTAVLGNLEGMLVRADQKSVAAGRDIRADQVVTGGYAILIKGGHVTIVQGSTPVADPPGQADERARTAYLRWVMECVGFVALGGVDPAVGSDKDRRLHLDAVYTALRTSTPRPAKGEVGPDLEAESELMEGREKPRLSALEQLESHERLVLLGDPGSGKSTFVDFVALCLAGESFPEIEGAGVELLTSPLPKDDGSDADERQVWSHGALLPVRVVLRDFAARGLGNAAERATAQDLWSFLEAELAEGQQGAFVPDLKEALEKGEALVLLDGLDEVPEAARRRKLICEAVGRFVKAYSKNRFVVTSRTYAYQKQDFRLPGFKAAELAPFGSGQIRLFTRRWYAEVAAIKGLRPEDAKGRATLLERAIFSSSRLRELAARPLLLTLMASLHAFRGGSLPEDREKLYEDTVELLLDVWEQKRRERNAAGELVLDEPSLTEWLKVERRDVLRVLQEIAYTVHRSQPELAGTADVAAGDLVTRLMDLRGKDPDVALHTTHLVEYLSQRSGILAERGDRVYTFPHRTFQEYLAARHLLEGRFGYDEIAGEGRRDPNRWREVILLAAARMGPLGVWELADALVFESDPPQPREDAWGAHLAAHAVAESANLQEVNPRNQKRLETLRPRCAAVLVSPELPAAERARAGLHLAKLGDPRFEALAWFLPAEATAGFVAVAGGEYTIGSDPKRDRQAQKREQPEHSVRLSPFWLGRWPVTVAQFQAFVKDSSVDVGDPRCLEGVTNQPVVYVSWDEAQEYCRWLTQRLVEMAPDRAAAAAEELGVAFWEKVAAGELQAVLPTEAQWEAAARGADARLYPWGDEKPTKEHANFGASGITPVGIYPRGRGPFGAEDQAGNVLEWCADVYDEEAYAKRAGEVPVDPCSRGKSAVRVLRGGSWGDPSQFLRAAYRIRSRHGSRYRDFGFRVCVSGPEHD